MIQDNKIHRPLLHPSLSLAALPSRFWCSSPIGHDRHSSRYLNTTLKSPGALAFEKNFLCCPSISLSVFAVPWMGGQAWGYEDVSKWQGSDGLETSPLRTLRKAMYQQHLLNQQGLSKWDRGPSITWSRALVIPLIHSSKDKLQLGPICQTKIMVGYEIGKILVSYGDSKSTQSHVVTH